MGLLFGGRKEAPSSRPGWSPVRSSDLASCWSWTHETALGLPCTLIGSLSQRPLHCIKSTALTPKASLCGPRAAYSSKGGQKLPSLVTSSKCEDTGADLPPVPKPRSYEASMAYTEVDKEVVLAEEAPILLELLEFWELQVQVTPSAKPPTAIREVQPVPKFRQQAISSSLNLVLCPSLHG